MRNRGYDFARLSLGAYALEMLPEFQIADHHQKIIRGLKRIESGESKRLIITAPPRHSKSILASEFFPAWAMGRKPSRQIILATYGQTLTRGFGRRIKHQLLSQKHSGIFPRCKINEDSKSTDQIETSLRGVFIGTSVGGMATGKGADILIIDDPVKDRAEAESFLFRQTLFEWYTSTARIRLQPAGAIVVISTRWHEDDLTGRLLEADKERHEWDHIHLKAIQDDGTALWPEWFDLEALGDIKREIGSYDWEALFQGSPTRKGGGLFKIDALRYYDPRQLPKFRRVIQSVDSATKKEETNDFTVIGTWGETENRDVYLIEVIRERLEYPDLKRAQKSTYERWNPDVLLIEDKSSGTQLIQEIRRQGINVLAVNPSKDKFTRALPFSAGIESGRVWLPKQHHHLADLVTELREFPSGRFDDFTDCATMAWDYFNSKQPPKRIKNPMMPG